MDQLTEKAEQELGKRSVRRRLVQSTLFPQRSAEIQSDGGDHNADKECEVEADNEDDQEFCCGSQGKKTRKRKEKTTSQATKVSKKVKEKSPKSTTPKKKGIGNGKGSGNLTESEEASPPIPNLRLEAKLTAEETSRLFAGKQMHPFFSSRKAGKKSQEMTEVDTNCCSIEKKDTSITIGPIHVFEKIQDEPVSIDWGNWTFCEKTFTNRSSCLEDPISPVFEGSVESLKFEKFPCDLHPYDASHLQDKRSLDQCCSQVELSEASPKVSVMSVDDQEENQLGESRFSGNSASVRKSDTEEKSTFPQESNQLRDSLWTDKYRPKNATEVCGNNESVKFMSEWLKLWHEREFRAIKDSSASDKCGVQDGSYDCYATDSDSENRDGGDGLKNVLLVTGPIGSGKSAAIHACANEKGFKVLENNASDCRLGAVVNQKFGEALKSRCLDRSLGSHLDLLNNNIMESTKILCNGETLQQVNDGVVEVIHTSDQENCHQILETSDKFVKEKTVYDKDVKPLILFEDVDIFFPEDRGFIAAIQQIAQKAKGPVILTSNSNYVILPENLDRLEVSFTMPSSKDLLSHLYMICAAEKVDIQCQLLEQLIGYCQTDIRKTIMHLQFWCQNKRCGKDKGMQKVCGSLLFDVEAGHQILPKIIPWDFPSQLSELVEKEITKSLSMMEQNSTLRVVAEEGGHNEMLISQNTHDNETDNIEVKKEAMLSRNCSARTSNEYGDFLRPACGFSDFPGTPLSLPRRNSRRKVNVVTSSDSEDDVFDYRCPVVADRDANKELFPEDYSRFPSHLLNTQDCINPSTDKLFHSEEEKYVENHYQCMEIANDNYMNDTCKSVDISCVSESTFVPETEIDNGVELLSAALCSDYVAETVEVSVGNGFDLNIAPVEASDKSPVILHKNSYMLGCDVAEPSQGEEVEDSQNEHVEAVSKNYQVLDECSRIDFERRYKPMVAVDLVKESWNKLHGSKADLKQYITSEKADAFQIVKLADGMCKLISESDLLLSNCQTVEFLELSKFPCEELDTFSWCDDHIQMTSAIAEHGFCFYAKNISTLGSNMGPNGMKDLRWEMFSCTTNVMGSGELLRQDVEASGTLHAGSGLEKILSESEVKSNLFNTVKSVVSKKSYLALKGDSFHEYLSSLSCISRSETSRLSELVNKTKKRRTRGARHYLSTGALMLSPEDISMLGQSNLYSKNSSQ